MHRLASGSPCKDLDPALPEDQIEGYMCKRTFQKTKRLIDGHTSDALTDELLKAIQMHSSILKDESTMFRPRRTYSITKSDAQIRSAGVKQETRDITTHSSRLFGKHDIDLGVRQRKDWAK